MTKKVIRNFGVQLCFCTCKWLAWAQAKIQVNDYKKAVKNFCRCVTPAIRIRQRPCHPGSPDVLSANGSLHFGRYSEACNGRVERFLCQVQGYFRSYYSGFYHYALAFSNDLPTLYIARPMTKRHFAADWVRRSSPPDWGGIIIFSVFLDCCDRFILPGRRSI